MTLITFQPAPRKQAFQLLNDLAVAADRAVQPLQIAVDDENQIVATFRGHARVIAPSVSGSSHSPSPRKAQTF